MIQIPKTKVYFLMTLTVAACLSRPLVASDASGFQYWSTADFSFDINKNWITTFQEQFRLGDEGGNLYYHHSELGFVYKGYADWIDLGFNFRKAYERDSQGTWRTENQPSISFTLKGRLGNIDLSSRSRFEYRDREKNEDLWRYRNKVTFKLPFEITELKARPYLADEVFINFNEEGYTANRFYSGLSFDLAKNIKGEIYYLWQSKRADPGRDDINAFGTTLKFLF
jgi:hypothetical protein